MQNLQNIVENLRKLYQQKYGVAVFNIDFKKTKKGIELSGEVLTESQRDDIINVLKKIKKNIIKENIKILADASKRNEIGWAVAKNKIVDLKSRFVSSKIINQKILKRIRCSQAIKNEILRVLYKNEDQLLVQQNDLSLGWAGRDEVVLKNKSLYKEWIQHFHTLGYGTKNKIFMAGADKSKIIKEAEQFLGTKYLLGGKTKKGIDCSGLVQVAYKNSLNIILPKHSWDQKEMGKKVNLKNVISGDLIFLIKKENSHKHVGIVEVIKPPVKPKANKRLFAFGLTMTRNINLIHASLEKKKVIRQDLDKVFENYDFVEARRVIE